MGEKKELEIRTKSPMWIVILVAVLVIALGCEFVYVKKLKQASPVVPEKENKVVVEQANVKDLKEEKEEETSNKKIDIADNFKEYKNNIINGVDMRYYNNSDEEDFYKFRYFYAGKYKGKLMCDEKEVEIGNKEVKNMYTLFSNKIEENAVYVLFADGTVGVISEKDIKNKKYKVSQVKDLKNIEYFLNIYEQEGTNINQGGIIELYGVDNTGKTVFIDSDSTGL